MLQTVVSLRSIIAERPRQHSVRHIYITCVSPARHVTLVLACIATGSVLAKVHAPRPSCANLNRLPAAAAFLHAETVRGTQRAQSLLLDGCGSQLLHSVWPMPFSLKPVGAAADFMLCSGRWDG